MCDLCVHCVFNSQPAKKILKIVLSALVTMGTLSVMCVKKVFSFTMTPLVKVIIQTVNNTH